MLSAVPLPVSFEPVERSISIDTELPATDAAGAPAEWVAWGCHGFLRNTDAPSQANACVAFRRLGDGEVYEEVLRTVPAAALGLMPLGSVWQENRSERQVVLTTRTFDVDHTEGQWTFTSFAEAAETGGAPPFPRKRAPPHESAERIRYLVLNLASGGRLVIPCAEYFTRLYGVSHYLRQVLLGYPWVSEGHPKNRLYGNPRITVEPDAWTVRLRPRLDDRDAIFLAHAKYDPFTARAAKRPYARLEASFDPKASAAPISFDAGPWYPGRAKIEVQGVPLEGGTSFLGLRITGCSVPAGPLIHIDRDNSNLAEKLAVEKGQGSAWRGTRAKATRSSELTGREEPDHGSPLVDVVSPNLRVIGPDRSFVKVSAEQAKSSAATRVHGSDGADDTLSSGESYRADKGVSYASVRAVCRLPSEGLVRAMWKAARSLHARRPDLYSKVEWYTFETGYRDTAEPELVAVPEFEGDVSGAEALPPRVRAWPYLDAAKSRRRGVIVMRLTVLGSKVHALEIERRAVAAASDGVESVATKAETFRGVLVRFDPGEDVAEWLFEFVSALRHQRGVVHRVLALFGNPSNAVWYQHRFTEDEIAPGERSLVNALRRLGYDTLPDP